MPDQKPFISGNPDPKNISISYMERQNSTMRMRLRRSTMLVMLLPCTLLTIAL